MTAPSNGNDAAALHVPSEESDGVTETSPESADATSASGSWVDMLRERARSPEVARFIKFGTVGASGVVVNMAVFWLSRTYLLSGIPDVDARVTWAGLLAIGISIVTNFLLNDAWTWGDREKGGALHFVWRFGKYSLVASVAGAAQFAVLKVLVYLGLHPDISNLIGIGAGIGINYFANHWWTFRAGEDDVPIETVTPAERGESSL